MNLFDYQAELDAHRALMTLREELALGINYAPTCKLAAISCRKLCEIAQQPNHYLGMELIKVLEKHSEYKEKEISSMTQAFLNNILALINSQRASNSSENYKPQ